MRSSLSLLIRRIPFWLWILLAVLLACAGTLAVSARTEGIGLPLDDAWIHQTYARNLAWQGEWAFIPGRPSSGSTAPFWSLLLSAGYLLARTIPYGWTFILGAASLAGLAIGGELIFRRTSTDARAPWAGLFLAGEWHLVWAALSGMETALMGGMIVVLLWLLGRGKIRWELAGGLIGLSAWVRPDGITLLGPALLVLVFSAGSWRNRSLAALRLAAGFLLFFLPYLFFNFRMEGSIWPNTFYAKQAEYAVLREQPIWLRFLDEFELPLVGGGLFLLPGFLYLLWEGWKKRSWAALAGEAWFIGYAFIYAWRLPVTYQHGRYLMPAMPVFFIFGLVGTALLLKKLSSVRIGWVLSRVWVLSLAGLWLGFYAIGAGQYAQDVAIIDSEMVATARWVAANTPADALVAAHDIGAMGYFGQRDLVDLAGLISPEVIPFIRDEARIRGFLDQQGAAYLVTFPKWYPELVKDKPVLFQTKGKYAPDAGGENMAVYRWK